MDGDQALKQREVRNIDIFGDIQIIINEIKVLKPIINHLIGIILARIHVLYGFKTFNSFHVKRDQNIMGGAWKVLPSSSCPAIGVDQPPLSHCSMNQHFLDSPHPTIPSWDSSTLFSSLVLLHHYSRTHYLESKIKNIEYKHEDFVCVKGKGKFS